MKSIIYLAVLASTTTLAGATELNNSLNPTQAEKLESLVQQFQRLKTELDQSKTTIKRLEQQINIMDDNSVLALDGYLKLGFKDGHPIAIFNAINVQVDNGTGRTDRVVNGLGNLIIGYNETSSNSLYFCSNPIYTLQSRCTLNGYQWGNNVRRGSHNLIIGSNNSYDDYGSIIAGVGNTSNANYSNILGGIANYTAAIYSNISGGRYNETHAYFSSITGGYDNVTNGKYSSILGGRENTATGLYSSISAGIKNTAEGVYSSVSGGQRNHAIGEYSSVSSGSGNQATATGSSVTGGQSNIAKGFMSNVSGGAIRVEAGYNAWRAGNLHQDY